MQPGESIQAAVDAAASGDTILVRPGSFGGNGGAALVHVRTSGLTLRASRSTVLDARGYRHGVLVGEEPPFGADACPPSSRCAASSWSASRSATPATAGLRLSGVDGFTLRDGVYLDNARHGASLVLLVARRGRGQLRGRSRRVGDPGSRLRVTSRSRTTPSPRARSASAIENSSDALVRKNQVFGNAAGIVVAVLPEHPLPLTDRVRIEENSIIENNFDALREARRIATFVATIPSGTGLLNAGGDHVSIERNVVLGNDSLGVAAVASPFARRRRDAAIHSSTPRACSAT